MSQAIGDRWQGLPGSTLMLLQFFPQEDFSGVRIQPWGLSPATLHEPRAAGGWF